MKIQIDANNKILHFYNEPWSVARNLPGTTTVEVSGDPMIDMSLNNYYVDGVIEQREDLPTDTERLDAIEGVITEIMMFGLPT